jgi:hypothetical protein
MRRTTAVTLLIGFLAHDSLAANLRIDRSGEANTVVRHDYQLTPNGQHVVYRQREGNDIYRIYSVPILGGESVDLTLDQDGMGDVDEGLHISPDSRFAVYTRRPPGWRRRAQLYSATIDGQASEGQGIWRVSDLPIGHIEADSIQISPESTHVVYVGQTSIETYAQLYSAPLATEGQQVQISPVTSTYTSTNNGFVFVEKGDRVVHTMAPTNGNNHQAIWTLSVDGAAQIQLASELTQQRDIATSGLIPITTSDDVLLFTHFSNGSGEWFKVPINGGEPTLLTMPEFDLDALDGQLTSDGQDFIVRQVKFGSPGIQLWRYPVSGEPGIQLLAPEDGIGSPGVITLPSQGDQMVFSTETPRSIYSMSTSDYTMTRLVVEDGFDPHQVYPQFKVSEDGEHVVFKADFDHDDIFDLYSIRTDGSGLIRLNNSSPEFGVITNYHVTANGERVVYTANHAGTQRMDAYSVPVDGGESRIISGAIEGELSNFGNPLTLSQDGFKALFIVTNRQTESDELYIAPVVPGDVNFDGVTDASDIDLLSRQLQSENASSLFDIDDSGRSNANDREYLISEILKSTAGDSDLNGVFDSSDLVSVFKFGRYEDGIDGETSWSAGDWNGDLEFDSADLVLAFKQGKYEQATDPNAKFVPEPKFHFWVLLTLVINYWQRRSFDLNIKMPRPKKPMFDRGSGTNVTARRGPAS